MMQQEDKDKGTHHHPALDFTNLTHETLAGYLLQSSDPKVQSAAKRIFSITESSVDACNDNAKFSIVKKNEEVSCASPCSTTASNYLLSTMASAAVLAEKASSTLSQNKGDSANKNTPSRAGCTIADLIACTSNSNVVKEGGSSYDKVQRRERNRMHARKTRQRKKEHMANLQGRAEELKQGQIKLRQAINEQNTATILLVMFGKSNGGANFGKGDTNLSQADLLQDEVSSEVDALLRRPVNGIPDSSQIPDLPALVYPPRNGDLSSMPDDGIDYELLSKDRSQCTSDELDRIRKERNRMHAKRTRDRKRMFMEEMETIIRTLETENRILYSHHEKLKKKKGALPGAISAGSTVASSSGTSICGDQEDLKDGDGSMTHASKKQRLYEPFGESVSNRKVSEVEDVANSSLRRFSTEHSPMIKFEVCSTQTKD